MKELFRFLTRTESGSENRLAVLVLGMHRSGTSLVTEVLGGLGLWLGNDEELIGATAFNPRGHFELTAGVEFNNQILQDAGGTWDNPPPSQSVDALASTRRPHVANWYAGRTAWAFKDPRLCLTLPVWMPVLAEFDVRIVHVRRDPLAVARSLLARNRAMDLPVSRFANGEMVEADVFALWAEYNRRAEAYENRFAVPVLAVSYDELVDAPSSQVGRIAAFVGRPQANITPAVQCVRQELRRSSRWPGDAPIVATGRS
jgi:hypothetical protein